MPRAAIPTISVLATSTTVGGCGTPISVVASVPARQSSKAAEDHLARPVVPGRTRPIAHGFLAARGLHQLDDALRRERHLVDADAERRQRILDGRGDRGGRDHPPTLAAALDAVLG